MNENIRHKVFISYDTADADVVDNFVDTYDKERNVFIARIAGAGMDTDVEINSDKPDYVMRRIRELYLRDSTVTILIVGDCTYSRKYADWEIASSLRQGPVIGSPNGLLGILVPGKTTGTLPERFKDNHEDDGTGYSRFRSYPVNKTQLRSWIDDAFNARTTRNRLISNGRSLRQRNSPCP